MASKNDALTLEKLKIHERLALAEGQLGAIKTLLEELHKHRDNVAVVPEKNGGGVAKSLGVAALLATVLVAVISPIHQKIDFTTRQIDSVKHSISDHEHVTGHAGSLSQLATVNQKFIEVETQFDAFEKYRQQAFDYLKQEDQHHRELMEAKIAHTREINDVRIAAIREASDANDKLVMAEIVHLKDATDCLRTQAQELTKIVWGTSGGRTPSCLAAPQP